MTDNEIIKALDICGRLEGCADCPLWSISSVDKCMHTLLLNALDLINRQKAEIEALINGQETLQKHIAEQKAEIERLEKNGWEEIMKFYWFEFADSYRCCVRGLSKQELAVEESKHGKLVRKVEA